MKEIKFKQTELGQIPEDWEVQRIGDIGYTFNGLTGKSAKDFGHGDARYITFLNVLNNPTINTSLFEKVNVRSGERQNAVQKDDLFFNTSSETPEEVGTCSVLLEDVQNVYLNSFCFGYRLKTESIIGLYLAYYFRCKEGRDLMMTLAQGSTRYNLSKESFLKSFIFVPPTVEEQKRIAEALSDVDGLLRELDAEIAKKRAIKQGAMQELLTGKRRLEGFGGEYKDSEFGLIPKDWTIVEIKNIGTLIRDSLNPQQYKTRDFYEYSMPAYDDGKKPVKCKGFTMNSNRTCIKGEVLLFNKLNVRQKRVWYVENAPNNSLCSMEFLALTSNTVDLRLLREVLLQNKVTQYFESASEGTSNSQKRINPSVFLNYRVVLPSSKAEQTAIAKILSDMDADIEALEAKQAKYAAVKQGMMQELLTGKIRLV